MDGQSAMPLQHLAVHFDCWGISPSSFAAVRTDKSSTHRPLMSYLLREIKLDHTVCAGRKRNPLLPAKLATEDGGLHN